MSREKTAAFLADCLAHMPEQTDEVKVEIAFLTFIADGGEWSQEEASAYWAAAWTAARAAALADHSAAAFASWAAAWAADYAARAHPNPDAERERQAKVREDLGL